ncbi:hypothetical protein BC936DRAFT_137016 [Jimgerdemannia flammicorona]|uniref:Uncharacterized protein n=1 Tax=Jimgerdemannia flammicorona TaxID=994334 RepID=A0A433CY88_9FUNG|nr:hypothetical protein BC936DRAFT_137016 [Jimgerdemannia flammicorona]
MPSLPNDRFYRAPCEVRRSPSCQGLCSCSDKQGSAVVTTIAHMEPAKRILRASASHLFRTLRPSSTTLLRPSRPSPPHLHLARHVTTISYPDLVLPPSHYTASAAAPANNHWPVRRPPSHFFNPTNIPGSPDFGANQDLRIDEETKQRLKAVLNTFRAPVRYAIAYGSGVFQQRGYETKKVGREINRSNVEMK